MELPDYLKGKSQSEKEVQKQVSKKQEPEDIEPVDPKK
jgi:hypothetical protein